MCSFLGTSEPPGECQWGVNFVVGMSHAWTWTGDATDINLSECVK